MHRWILLVASLSFCCVARSQAQNGSQNWLSQNNGAVSVFDKDGKPFTNEYADADGSAFFTNDWLFGQLVLADNAVYNHVRLRLNLQNQKVHFISPNGTEMVAPEGIVKSLTLYDSTTAHPSSYIFQCGFPGIDNQDARNFYEILSNGKVQFIRSLRKVISQQKNELTGEIKKEFLSYEDYYVAIHGALVRAKKDKTFILNLLNDKEDELKAFIDDRKLKFRSFDDITQITTYYNSLP